MQFYCNIGFGLCVLHCGFDAPLNLHLNDLVLKMTPFQACEASYLTHRHVSGVGLLSSRGSNNNKTMFMSVI